ncbi:hypothetical protein BD779DRAFT_1560506 [Infundibulicybe gibba]|nr:hypothetical protein BD779DRAFT_1560506 [Infundibulicybe gibba]
MNADPSPVKPPPSYGPLNESATGSGQSPGRLKILRPKRPPLYSDDYPHYYVLTFPTTLEFLEQWGIDHGLTTERDEFQTNAAWNTINAELWKYGCQWGVVRSGGMDSLGIVVASNLTPADMAKADDLEAIRAAQSVLGITGKPLWRKPVDI